MISQPQPQNRIFPDTEATPAQGRKRGSAQQLAMSHPVALYCPGHLPLYRRPFNQVFEGSIMGVGHPVAFLSAGSWTPISPSLRTFSAFFTPPGNFSRPRRLFYEESSKGVNKEVRVHNFLPEQPFLCWENQFLRKVF